MTETQHLEPAYDVDRLMTEVIGAPPMDVPAFAAPELTPLDVSLEDATVGLLVTCGAYYPDQPRLGETDDISYRLLPRDRDLTDILIAHRTPVRAFAEADPNVAYPRDRILELERDGWIGRYADNAVSMVGSIRRYEELATETAPALVEEFRAMGTDLVLVAPFCPQCHIAAGVLARAIEKRGMSTTSIETVLRQALGLKPPRATFLDFPLGCPFGRPYDSEQQLEILHSALLTGSQAGPDWELKRLPFHWDESGDRLWEGLVDDLYRIDNQVRGTVAARMKHHATGGQATLVGDESAFAIRCAC